VYKDNNLQKFRGNLKATWRLRWCLPPKRSRIHDFTSQEASRHSNQHVCLKPYDKPSNQTESELVYTWSRLLVVTKITPSGSLV